MLCVQKQYSALYADCRVVLSTERVPGAGGAVHGLRVRADGPVSRHAGGGGGAGGGSRRERHAGLARQAEDGDGVRGEEGATSSLLLCVSL